MAGLKLFGFEIRKSEEDSVIESFAEPNYDDGALTVGNALGGSYGMLLDLDGGARTEAELVTKYRNMLMQAEIQRAVDEVVNDAINIDTEDEVVKIVLDKVELSDNIKKKISDEFDEILRLLDFSNNGYEIFQKFYVDGRLNYHAIVDPKKLKSGILELRYIDPRKIRLIREMDNRKTDRTTGANLQKVRKEYFMYSESGFGTASPVSAATSSGGESGISGLKIAKDSIIRVTSGLMNENNSMVVSHLHKAIKPLNQLRILEDSTVIYTLTRAPERRIFYIDVGNLPKAKAEQYLQDMMARHKNKLQYNATTGEVTDARRMMTMTEDFWFPRRGGDRSTEIDTLAGGTGLMDNQNLPYFKDKLYESLGVPTARLKSETMFTFGRPNETSREEMKFAKFIRRLRARFSILFDQCLQRQLILKGIITPDDWNDIKDKIRYDFMRDNYFEELKQTEIIREKIQTLRDVEDHVGTYFSRSWVIKNVLFMGDDDYKEMRKEIAAEKKAGIIDSGEEVADEEPEDQDQDTPQPPTSEEGFTEK